MNTTPEVNIGPIDGAQRDYYITLTDSEWIQLIDGDSDDTELQTCCANISALRDTFVGILRQGRARKLCSWDRGMLIQKLTWVIDGHELTPLLRKVCEQIGFDPSTVEGHDPQTSE
jgi:hypothetical protein